MENVLIIKTYLIYLPIVLGLTFFVAQVLFRTGSVFMLDIFNGREDIAEATNKLFQMGFYLVNVGFALRIMHISYHKNFDTYQEMLETLSTKIGAFSIYLGFILFANLFMFFRGKRASKRNRMTGQSINSQLG